MRDHMEARLWADHGHQFSEDLGRLFAAAMTAFHRLAAIQFDAPWRDVEPALAAERGAPPRLKLAGLALGAALTTVAATLAASGAVAPAVTGIA